MGCSCNKDKQGGVIAATPSRDDHNDTHQTTAAEKTWTVSSSTITTTSSSNQSTSEKQENTTSLVLGIQHIVIDAERETSIINGCIASANTHEFATAVEDAEVSQSPTDNYEQECRERIAASPVMDITTVMKTVCCDAAFVKEAFEMLIEQWAGDEPTIREQLDKAKLGTGDASIVMAAAHSLKGAAASLSLMQVSLASKMLEDQARQLHAGSSFSVCSRAHLAFDLLREAMATFRQRLTGWNFTVPASNEEAC